MIYSDFGLSIPSRMAAANLRLGQSEAAEVGIMIDVYGRHVLYRACWPLIGCILLCTHLQIEFTVTPLNRTVGSQCAIFQFDCNQLQSMTKYIIWSARSSFGSDIGG
jgi:hypothetical protein